MFQIQPESRGGGRQLAHVVGDARRETFTLTVDDASRIRPGAWVTLSVKGKAVVPGVIAPYRVSDLPAEWTRIHRNGVALQEHHKVAAVQGNRVTLREPVKTAILADCGWTVSEYPNIAEVGVEDICFEGAWLGKFVHHRSVMDDAGWAGLKMFQVVDSWVRHCASSTSTPASATSRAPVRRPWKSSWPARWATSPWTTTAARPACSTDLWSIAWNIRPA